MNQQLHPGRARVPRSATLTSHQTTLPSAAEARRVKPVHRALALFSAALLFAGISPARAASDEVKELLDLLVQKGVVSKKEASALASKAQANASRKSSGKETVSEKSEAESIAEHYLKVDPWVKDLTISGDVRLRYANQEAEAAGTTDHIQRERELYRLRLSLNGIFADDWFFGLRLETANGSRSTNVTFGDNPAFGKGSVTTDTFVNGVSVTTGKAVTGIDPTTGKPITGSFVTGVSSSKAKAVTKVNFGSAIFLGQIYAGYKPTDWLSLEAGRVPNPFVSTPMVWDPDINPEGVVEQLKYKVGKAEFFANLGQFIYDDADPENALGAAPNKNDSYLLGWQLGAKYNFSKTTSLQIAPTFYNYNGTGDDFNTTFVGDGPKVILVAGKPVGVTFNNTGINNLAVLDIPAEFRFKAGKLPVSIFGDLAYNLEGDTRAARASHAGADENLAWQAGVGVGGLKKKGDFEVKSYWQHVEQFAVDPNLIDNDLFDGRLNVEGFYVSGAYAFTDAVSLRLTYARGTRINHDLGTAGIIGTLGTTPVDNTQLFFADLNVKF